MLTGRKLILDTRCEVYDIMRPWADDYFWNLGQHQVVPNSIYLIGRQQCKEHTAKLKEMTTVENCLPILSNPHEGSDTIRWQMRSLNIEDLVVENKILLVSGGDIEEKYPNLGYDSFLTKILDYESNVESVTHTNKIFEKTDKPYKFLFLNGRARPHRKYLLETFRKSGLLDQSLWTCLDGTGFNSRALALQDDDVNLMLRNQSIQYLPEQYELEQFRKQLTAPNKTTDPLVKFHLFGKVWGDVYIFPKPYIDTYFSLVTETIFEYPYSFRTEKIWKPIAIGHPWIAVSNCGFYKDIKNLGFRTFDHLIDESFDKIENNQDRIDRISAVVDDLCQQDLSQFLAGAKEVCKYNQQRLLELIPVVSKEFPERLHEFTKKYI